MPFTVSTENRISGKYNVAYLPADKSAPAGITYNETQPVKMGLCAAFRCVLAVRRQKESKITVRYVIPGGGQTKDAAFTILKIGKTPATRRARNKSNGLSAE